MRGNMTRKLVLAALFAGLGVLLSALAIPVGGTRVFPVQHALNAVAGVLLGPWWAAGSALVTATLRFAFGTGTVFAFPGSPFGALAVGFAYLAFRRDWAALFEPVGTVFVGAVLAAALISPLLGIASGGLVALMVAFALSSIPGAIIGFLVLKLLRRSGAVGKETDTTDGSRRSGV
ncbi:thiW: thiW protein [Rubrobacter radiotolerans]|uniref:Energy coupling factor transporter S component ThiW n=1 Tax=Rubrobacter radiotolerans TaxID=42256 RepID=A0A023X6L8_RUBRA|nr:energy coupling factor transporter S component ThiW [Rubrobacter radiotolerans]AHY47714.1 thiW: thiW protein [Rubrobacter radiotolerans]MDX5895117.1 energy coupling factor transporter S component ThiW [Rubrobacter radiotolerans]SMC07487.1 energy coupling factor transporter S component ThiW [Rubrobacter radiotolerans DSM 5868]